MDILNLSLPLSTLHLYVVFSVIFFAMVMYATQKISLELTSALVIGFFLIYFTAFPLKDLQGHTLLTPGKIFQGFANQALIAILSLLVLGQAVIQTGALNGVARFILRLTHGHYQLSVILALVVVLIVSGVLNNTPVVVIFIPIMSALAHHFHVSNSVLMMPLSYVAILGGSLTLIGSSTNLLVSQIVTQMGERPLTFFEFTPMGIANAAVGLVYILFFLPKLLPQKIHSLFPLTQDDADRQFITQFYIKEDSDLVGIQLSENSIEEIPHVTIRMIQRSDSAYLFPLDTPIELRAGDNLTLACSKQALGDWIRQFGDGLSIATDEPANKDDPSIKDDIKGTTFVEVVVAPASRLVGFTIEQLGLQQIYQLQLLGIQRHAEMLRTSLPHVRLLPGDVLLMLGSRKNIASLEGSADLLLLEQSTEEIKSNRKSVLANVIFFGVIFCAAFEALSIATAGFIGATLCILTGCIDFRQAMRVIDSKIVFLLAASFAMSQALQATGGAQLIAHTMLSLFEGASISVILSCFFIIVALCTNILSNNACALLYTPIGINLAEQLSVDPRVFIMAVIFASSCSYLTPIGYQTNLLVMAPGHYSFKDFIRGGLPITLILWVFYSLFAPYYFGLYS